MANKFYQEKEFLKAAMYYKKVNNEKKEKWSYYQLAAKYNKEKKYLQASIYYKKSGNEAKAKFARKQYEQSAKNAGKATNLIYTYLLTNIHSMKYSRNRKNFLNYLVTLEKQYGTVSVYNGLKNARLRASLQTLKILNPAMKQYKRTRSAYVLSRANKQAAPYTTMSKIINAVLKSMEKK